MAIALDLVGRKWAPIKHAYGWKDVVLYALGVGAKIDELDFLYEMNGPKVLPTFAVVPAFSAFMAVSTELGVNPIAIVQGEHRIELHRPIPPSGELTTIAEVTGIYDKGKGALVAVHARTTDDTGEPLFDNGFSIFVRGAGGFGGARGPEALQAEPPEGRAPDFSMTETTLAEEAALYRLSGGPQPHHISPLWAKVFGFERPILHGLCTFGHAGRAFLKHACGGDPRRFGGFAARFAGVVFPGDALTTEGWQVDPGRWVLRTRTQDGRVVLSNSVATTV